MKKYAKVINEETKACEVGLGTNVKFYQSIGMIEMEVEQAYDGQWYLQGFAPVKPEPTREEVEANRALLYKELIDPITSHISRLRDEEQTDDILAQIEALKAERQAKIDEVKKLHPYPVEEEKEDGVQ